MIVRKLKHALSIFFILLASAGAASAQRDQRLLTRPARTAAGISYLFVSPNTREGLSNGEALRKLDSGEEIELVTTARGLTRCLGMKAVIAKALGSWADGAEHMALIKTTADGPTVRYVDARLGLRARQKSVLYFRVQAVGRSKMYVLLPRPGVRDLPVVNEILDRSGVQYRTLIPGPRRVVIYAVDLDGELEAGVKTAARLLGGRYKVLTGEGAFIGDDEDRDRASEVYRRVIIDYESSSPRVRDACGDAGQDATVGVKKVAPNGRANSTTRQLASRQR